MSAVLIGTRCRHVNIIPVKVDVTNRGIVKTIAQRFCIGDIIKSGIVKTVERLVTSSLPGFVAVAPAPAN